MITSCLLDAPPAAAQPILAAARPILATAPHWMGSQPPSHGTHGDGGARLHGGPPSRGAAPGHNSRAGSPDRASTQTGGLSVRVAMSTPGGSAYAGPSGDISSLSTATPSAAAPAASPSAATPAASPSAATPAATSSAVYVVTAVPVEEQGRTSPGSGGRSRQASAGGGELHTQAWAGRSGSAARHPNRQAGPDRKGRANPHAAAPAAPRANRSAKPAAEGRPQGHPGTRSSTAPAAPPAGSARTGSDGGRGAGGNASGGLALFVTRPERLFGINLSPLAPVATGSPGPSTSSPGPALVLPPDPFHLPFFLPRGWEGDTLQAATKLKVPLALLAAMAVFALVQALVDRRDPKLSEAPERPGEDSVGFE